MFKNLKNGTITLNKVIYGRDDDDDDDDDDEEELFLWYGWPAKDVWPHFQPGPLPETLTTASLWHAVCRVWTWAEPEFRLSWMKLSSKDNHYRYTVALLGKYYLIF